MKTLTKHIECGKYSFDVAIDREIAIKAMEEYPDLAEFVFNQAKKELKTPKSSTKQKDEIDLLIDNIRSKKTQELLNREEMLKECAKFAFPLMLKKAGSELNAEEIIDYIYENNVESEFSSGIYEMILKGFTQSEVLGKPKTNFAMK